MDTDKSRPCKPPGGMCVRRELLTLAPQYGAQGVHSRVNHIRNEYGVDFGAKGMWNRLI